MKSKLFIITMVFIVGINNFAFSDEGMWLPLFINRLNNVDLQKMGLKLTPEEIYSVNNGSIKDAIVMMGDNSAGSIISQNGLVLTSHWFAYEYLRANSTPDKDLLNNGYWSSGNDKDLPNPGLTVSFLVKIEDVTSKILPKISGLPTEAEKNAKYNEIVSKLISDATLKTTYTATVKGFYENTEFYLFVYETYKDIRLVGAPPLSIARFGGDKDNWMWPRHSCEFALFRIYASPDGKPAEYAPTNVPLKSKKTLPLSIKGFNENDFTLMLGFPLKSDRYLPSENLKIAIQETNPTIEKILEKKLEVLKESIKQNNQIRIDYLTKYAKTSNEWKFYIGQTRQLEKFHVYDIKKTNEIRFNNWANADDAKANKYGSIIKDINSSYNEIKKYNLYNVYFDKVVLNGTDLLAFANKFYPIYNEMKGLKKKALKSYKIPESLKSETREYVKSVGFDTDKKLFTAMFTMFYENLPKDQSPDFFNTVKMEYYNDISKYAEAVYSRSIFANADKLWSFINNPDVNTLEFDYAFKTLLSCIQKKNQFDQALLTNNIALGKAQALYEQGLKEMYFEKNFYPDANGSLRFSYGKIAKYYPVDGLESREYTTLKGVIEKEDTSDVEFLVPTKLKNLYSSKDYGQYGQNGQLNVCFTTNNDALSGNSGSPILNGEGEIIGIVFDSNWEGMCANYQFETDLQRAISVDVRYILFIIDKYAGAKNIIDELTIAK